MWGDRLSSEEEVELIDLTKRLISIPSTGSDDNSIYEFVKQYLSKRDFSPFGPKFDYPFIENGDLENVYAKAGAGKGPRIMLNCHLDSVNLTEGWFHPPFEAVEEDGRIYGLGAADMKGGCAAAIIAFTSFLKRMEEPEGEIFLSCVFGEEAPLPLGADSLIREFDLNDMDLIIVTEPSPLLAIYDHCTIHKRIHKTEFPVAIVGAEGRAIFEIDFMGKASHASHPSQGINALHDAARVINELARFDLYSNIKMGRGHYVVLNIDGGDESFTVPSKCRIYVNRQLTLGEDDRTVLVEIKRIIRSLKLRSKWTIQKRHSPSPALEYKPYLNENNEYIHKFNELLPERKVGRGKLQKCLFTSSSVGDFNLFATRTKAPVLVFGPGGGNIHAPNEYVNKDEVVQTANYILKFLMGVFGDG
jgi:succinyl-diaminopimelate desuccinylase